MFGKKILFSILAFVICIEAKKVKPTPSHPYIYNLELQLREDAINDYIVDSFFATITEDGSKLLHCDITLLDLIKAVPIKKISVLDFVKALEELNLSQDEDELNALIQNLTYDQFKALGFSAEKIFKNFDKTYFKDRPADLLQCLNILGIAEEFSIAYTFGTDEDIFNAFQNGNYSYNNLLEIGKLIGGPSTLKDLLNVFGLKKLNEATLSNVINEQIAPALVHRGLTEENLKGLLEALGLGVSNYKESKVFKKCYSSLTEEKSLAVAISQNALVTNDDSVLIKFLNLEPYTRLVATRLQDKGITYEILADNIKRNGPDNIIQVQVNGLLSNFIDQASGIEGMSGATCEFIRVYFDQLLKLQRVWPQRVWPAVSQDQITITNLFNVPFKKGSPLVCNDKLYGLASISKFNGIIFDVAEDNQVENTPSSIRNNSEIIDAIKEYFANVYPNYDPCKYINCHKDKESGESEENVNNNELISSETNEAKDDEENHEKEQPIESEETSEENLEVSNTESRENSESSEQNHTESKEELGTEQEDESSQASSVEEVSSEGSGSGASLKENENSAEEGDSLATERTNENSEESESQNHIPSEEQESNTLVSSQEATLTTGLESSEEILGGSASEEESISANPPASESSDSSDELTLSQETNSLEETMKL